MYLDINGTLLSSSSTFIYLLVIAPYVEVVKLSLPYLLMRKFLLQGQQHIELQPERKNINALS